MNNNFFEKTSDDFGEFRISNVCLDRLSKQGCRHWIVYDDGKTNQLKRSTIIELLTSKNIQLPLHYQEEENEKNDKCIIL